jgi:SAM-dependent methyltransferase
MQLAYSSPGLTECEHPGLTECKHIDDFLAFWLSSNILARPEQTSFDYYYRSYKRYFGPYIRYWYRRQTTELLELVRMMGRPHVLEVGCGCGTESIWSAIQGADVTGIDIDDGLLDVARSRLDFVRKFVPVSCRLERLSLLDVDDADRFDIIFLEQAFHHVEPRDEAVAKLAKIVADDGFVVFSEANAWNPLIQAMLFKLRGFNTVTTFHGSQWGNERIIFPNCLIGLFAKHGFRRRSLKFFRTLPNVPIADGFLTYDTKIPQIFLPLFTHYNLVLERA